MDRSTILAGSARPRSCGYIHIVTWTPLSFFFCRVRYPAPLSDSKWYWHVPKNFAESDTRTRVAHRHPHPCPCNTVFSPWRWSHPSLTDHAIGDEADQQPH